MWNRVKRLLEVYKTGVQFAMRLSLLVNQRFQSEAQRYYLLCETLF